MSETQAAFDPSVVRVLEYYTGAVFEEAEAPGSPIGIALGSGPDRLHQQLLSSYKAMRASPTPNVAARSVVPSSRIDVQIDMSSEDSKDKDRDQTIKSVDVFDVAHSPTAHYVTKSITKTANGYSAVGALTLRGVTKDVPIDFQFTQTATGAQLAGDAKLKRLDFGVGQGDWKSTEWIGDVVKVSFSLLLKSKT